MRPGDHIAIWLAVLAVSTVVAVWNTGRLWAVRPAFDRLMAVLGACAILAIVVGASLVLTEIGECAFAPSSLACSDAEIALVAATDLAVGAALISLWLRSDACRAPRPLPRTRRRRAVPVR